MANDLLFDAARGVLYISTPAKPGDTRFPSNAIAAMDLNTGQIVHSLSFPSTAGNLALSDDGSALYSAFDAEGVVRRIDPDAFQTVSQFSFRSPVSNSGGYSRSSIAVQPGNPSTVAIYRYPTVGISGTTISVFDNGVKRANDGGSLPGYDGMVFSPDGQYLFVGSYSNFNSPQTVLRYAVDSTGIPTQLSANMPSAPGGGPVAILNGILYTSRGTLIDINSMNLVGSIGIGGSLAVDQPNSRIYCTYFNAPSNSENYPEFLQSFDLKSLEALGSVQLDSPNYFGPGASDVQKLFRFGSDGLIFSASTGLLVFHTPIAGPAPAITAPAIVNGASQLTGPVAPGEIIALYGTNLGPAVAQSATLNASHTLNSSLANVQVWVGETVGTVLLASQKLLWTESETQAQTGHLGRCSTWTINRKQSASRSIRSKMTMPGLGRRHCEWLGKGAIAF